MGRPLNKRYFGEPSDLNNEIKVHFHDGSAILEGWIVKQLGAKRFRCTDGTLISGVLVTTDCKLTDSPTSTPISNKGEMTISVKDDAGLVHVVSKISARKVTTFSGVVLPWNFSSSTTDKAAEIESAGGPATPVPVAITYAIEGVEYEIDVPGTTDFTLYGAADSIAGTVFIMENGPGEGDGTVISPSADAFTH